MRFRTLGRSLAVLAIFGTVMLFLFPIASGPYSATHGPVTPLRAMRYSFLVRLSIVLVGLSWFRICAYKFLFVFLAGIASSEILRLPTQPFHNVLNLRC
jgi:hypothetical protein